LKILTKQGYIKAVALFWELDDTQLNRIKEDNRFMFDNAFMEGCAHSTGNHAHFYLLCNQEEPLDISEYIKVLLRTYTSVSWWDKQTKEFHIVRG
jgi:hypothetical protein